LHTRNDSYPTINPKGAFGQRGFIRDVILAGRHAAACLMRRPQQVLGPIAAAKSSGAALSRGNAGVDIELDPVEGLV
jgi:hypothetical protein